VRCAYAAQAVTSVADENGATESSSGSKSPKLVVCWLAPAELEPGSLANPPDHPLADFIAIGATKGGQAFKVPDSTGMRAQIVPIDIQREATLAHLTNQAAARWPGADLALVFPGARLPEFWLERLRETVVEESTSATASSLHRSALALEKDQRLSLGGGSVATFGHEGSSAAAVAEASARIHPRIAAVAPTCVYVLRSAFDLVGPLDETFHASYAAILDFALRARERGLGNLLVDDLLVSAPTIQLQDEDEHKLRFRHAALMEAIDQPEGRAVERSLALASVALEPLSVTLDARALGPQVGGTQVYLLHLLESLAGTGQVRLRVLVAPDLAPATSARLRALPGEIDLLTYEQALERPDPSHIVHRPQQVFSSDDLVLLRPLGRRMVITHHDLIAYHNPNYFPSFDLWQRFLRTTRAALAAADHVLFFSRHALRDAAREDLVEPSRSSVAHLGVDLDEWREGGIAESERGPPTAAASLHSSPFLLCIGADYQHKNRPFALAVLDELRRRHDWPGLLVFAGPHVQDGSSRPEERAVRDRRSIPPALVIDLATVSEGERLWLMHRATAVIYPTVHEGFGLVPFEAAASGVPCLFAAQSSLSELLDRDLATLIPWDPARSAELAFPLTHEGDERRRHIDGLLQSAQALRWADCASATVAAYHKAVAAPYRASSEDPWQALEREREIVRLDLSVKQLSVRVRELSDDLGEDAQALVGPRALLSRSDQHALLAVAARPIFHRLLFGTLRGGFRVMRAIRRP